MALQGDTVFARTLDWLAGPRYFDSRTQGWPLTSWQAAVILPSLYLGGVWLGQKWMADRKPYHVRRFAITHNLFMALLSMYMVIETLEQAYISCGWDKKFRLYGQIAEPGNTFTPAGQRLATVLWIHYLTKAYEWVDTFIIIAKKNTRQITFLHLYHHASTYLTWWLIIRTLPGGDSYFLCAINSAVHVVMYSYYFIASTGAFVIPQPVKQATTLLQIVQFVTIVTGTLYIAIMVPEFRPRYGLLLTCLQSIIFLSLFSDFFTKAYRKKEKVEPAKPAYISVKQAYATKGLPLEFGRYHNGYSHLLGWYKPLPGQKPGERPQARHLRKGAVAA